MDHEDKTEESLDTEETAVAEDDAATDASAAKTSVDELELSLDIGGLEGDGVCEGEADEESSVPRADQLAAQIESLQAESDAHRDKWLRAMAELENFRKRTRRDFESSINLAKASVFRQLLEVVDNFERALDAVDPEAESSDLVKGVELIRDQLLRTLRDNNVHRIEAIGQPFDPNLHEAVSQIETEDVPAEHVAQVVQEGYQLGEMVLRPAVVVVAR
jgi:molecular chaperone GrpE